MYVWEREKTNTHWSRHPKETIEECIEDAKQQGCRKGSTIYIGEMKKAEINVNFTALIDHVEMQMYMDVGEPSIDWEVAKSTGREELFEKYQGKLLDLVNDYLDEIDMQPDFYKIQNIREVAVK